MHNTFALVLEDLIDAVPGAVGAIFADWEGEAVDHVATLDAMEIKLIGAHLGILLRLTDGAMHATLGVGHVEELLIEAERMVFLVRPVTDRYYVVLTLGAEAQLGRARRELTRFARMLYDKM